MSFLARATRPVKGLDQQSMGAETYYPGTYIPLEELRTWTGMGIDAQTALNYIAVYQCIRVLSNTFAQLPVKLYRQNGLIKSEATDHPLYPVLHDAPNPEMTSFVWRKILMRHILTWGNHYSEKTYDQVGRLQLWPFRPDRIVPTYNDDGVRVYDYLESSGRKRRLKIGSVFHVQGQHSGGLVGSSPIADLRKTLSVAQSAARYGTSVFENGARPGVVLSHPKTLSEPAIGRLAAQMDELRGSKNAGKTVVLEEGLQVTPIGFPPEDAQFLETQLQSHRLVYGAYGVPPHKVADLERATFSNIEHSSIEYIQDGVVPWCVNFEQETKLQLIDDDDVFARILVEAYLRGDMKSQAEALQIERNEGIINGDEWRALKDLNPIEDGSGQIYWMPQNYKTADKPGEVQPAPEEPPIEDLAIRSMKAVRCGSCDRLLGEVAPPYRFTCPRCKTVSEAA